MIGQLAGAAFVVAISAMALDAAVPEICTRCEAQVDLDQARWQCLLRQRPALQRDSTPVVFLQLDARSCNSQAGASRSGSIIIPVTDDRNGGNFSPVYVLSQFQLACLARKAGSVRPTNNRFVFNFRSLCP